MTNHTSLVAALAAFHGDVAGIHKASKAQFGAYADLATVLSAITPALAKNGLVLVQTFDTEGDDDILVTTLYHTSDQNIYSRARLVRVEGSGGRQNPLHLWGGSVTYARRFCALALLGLAAGMEDDDGDMADPPKKPAAARRTRAKPPTPPTPAAEGDRFTDMDAAHTVLSQCSTAKELAMWVARLKASELAEPDVNELRASYAEHVASLEEARA